MSAPGLLYNFKKVFRPYTKAILQGILPDLGTGGVWAYLDTGCSWLCLSTFCESPPRSRCQSHLGSRSLWLNSVLCGWNPSCMMPEVNVSSEVGELDNSFRRQKWQQLGGFSAEPFFLCRSKLHVLLLILCFVFSSYVHSSVRLTSTHLVCTKQLLMIIRISPFSHDE